LEAQINKTDRNDARGMAQMMRPPPKPVCQSDMAAAGVPDEVRPLVDEVSGRYGPRFFTQI
jgi:hypothetical protein